MKINSKPHYLITFSYLMLAVAFIAVLLLRILIAFSYVPETGGVSVNVLFSLVRMMNGYPLYADPQLPPYPVVQYMPLHYYLVATIGKVLALQNDIHAISVLNRLLCLAFDLLAFVPITKMLTQLFEIKNRKLIAAVCMSVFLVLPNPNYARVDNLYLLMFMCALYFFMQYLSDENKHGRKLIYAATAISLGLFTKQSGLFLLAGTGLYLLLIHRNWKATFKFSLAVIACCTLLFLVLVQTNYFAFYQNTVLGLNNGISINWFNEVIIKTFFYKMYFFVACGLALAVLSFINLSDARLKYLGTVSIVVLLCSVMASLKWGSSTNYFTEFLAITFILGAVYFANTSTPQHLNTPTLQSQHRNTSTLQHLILLFITPFFILCVFNDKGWGHLSSLKKSQRLYSETLEVKEYVLPKLKKGDLLFTTFHKENLLNVLLYEYSIFPHREIVTHCSYPKKIFNYNDFPNRLQNGEIKYLIGKKNEQPTSFLNGTYAHFVPDTTIGQFSVFKLEIQ